MHPQPLQRGLVAVKFGQGVPILLQQDERLTSNAGLMVNPHMQAFCACHGAQLLQRVLGDKRGGHLLHPQCGLDASNGPAQAAIDAHRAQAIGEGFSAGPAPQGLRAAQQIVRGLLGRNRGAVHQFQRGERLGLSGSAAGVCAVFGCLHRSLLSIPAARACDVQGFRSGMVQLRKPRMLSNNPGVLELSIHAGLRPVGWRFSGFAPGVLVAFYCVPKLSAS